MVNVPEGLDCPIEVDEILPFHYDFVAELIYDMIYRPTILLMNQYMEKMKECPTIRKKMENLVMHPFKFRIFCFIQSQVLKVLNLTNMVIEPNDDGYEDFPYVSEFVIDAFHLNKIRPGKDEREGYRKKKGQAYELPPRYLNGKSLKTEHGQIKNVIPYNNINMLIGMISLLIHFDKLVYCEDSMNYMNNIVINSLCFIFISVSLVTD